MRRTAQALKQTVMKTVEVKLQKIGRKIGVKFHMVAVLDYNIILAAKVTGANS